MKFTSLTNQLNALALEAKELDRRRGENRTPLFDKRLFSCLSKLLLPCVEEVQTNLNYLIKNCNQLDSQKATHLCEKLLAQISALQRELATKQVRRKEKSFTPKMPISIHQLHKDLAQHLEWERRLTLMVKEAQNKLSLSQTYLERQQKQQFLLATENRLTKCMEARKKIERRISYQEAKG